jgi:hypothetical protein
VYWAVFIVQQRKEVRQAGTHYINTYSATSEACFATCSWTPTEDSLSDRVKPQTALIEVADRMTSQMLTDCRPAVQLLPRVESLLGF